MNSSDKLFRYLFLVTFLTFGEAYGDRECAQDPDGRPGDLFVVRVFRCHIDPVTFNQLITSFAYSTRIY